MTPIRNTISVMYTESRLRPSGGVLGTMAFMGSPPLSLKWKAV